MSQPPHRGCTAESLSSLDLIASKVQLQLEHQLRHFDGLDNKAGLVLGFAGVLVAVVDSFEPLTIVGKIVAAGAAVLALWTFLPREYPVLDTRKLRDRYLRADSGFTKLHLVDTQIKMEEEASELLDRKALRLKLAVSRLALAVLMIGIGMLLSGGNPYDRRTETRTSSSHRRRRGAAATAAL